MHHWHWHYILPGCCQPVIHHYILLSPGCWCLEVVQDAEGSAVPAASQPSLAVYPSQRRLAFHWQLEGHVRHSQCAA